MASSEIVFTVLYDNVATREDLKPAHGFACLIDHTNGTILFDTGGDQQILMENMAALGRDPAAVDTVIISHPHWDHAGGLFGFLRAVDTAPRVVLPITPSDSGEFIKHTEMLGGKVVSTIEPTEIAPGIRTTGRLEAPTGEKDRREQGLVIETSEGPIVLTGCAHPGIENITRRAVELCPGEPALVMGGFHLRDAKDPEVAGVIGTLRGLGVKRLGTSHCTGRQVAAFRTEWGGDFVEFGAGSVVRAAA